MSSEPDSSEQTKKSILKLKHELNTNFGSYNLYAKRASFKDDGVLQQFVAEMAGEPVIAPPVLEEVIPIVADCENRTDLTEEEKAKRKEFERKRREVATPEGLDIKAVLGHRMSISKAEDDDDDEEEESDDNEAKEDDEFIQKNVSSSFYSNPSTKKPQVSKQLEKN